MEQPFSVVAPGLAGMLTAQLWSNLSMRPLPSPVPLQWSDALTTGMPKLNGSGTREVPTLMLDESPLTQTLLMMVIRFAIATESACAACWQGSCRFICGGISTSCKYLPR